MSARGRVAGRRAARALRHRNFRLFFAGQSLSLVGTWMQRVAVGWLVYRLTDSPLLLGVVSFAGQIPSFLLAPVAGALADRWDRHRMLVATQVLAMLQALVLAALVLSERVEVWQVIALSVVLGVVNGFDMPVRQSFMIEMLDDKTDLGNAIALNSTMVNGARMLGPAIAGLLVAAVGRGGLLPRQRRELRGGHRLAAGHARRAAAGARPAVADVARHHRRLSLRPRISSRCGRCCCSSDCSAWPACPTPCSCRWSRATSSAAARPPSAS